MRLKLSNAQDPYAFTRDEGRKEFTDISARQRVDPRIVAGERTYVFVVAGQSLASNQVRGSGNLYTPSSSKVHNLLFSNGGVYRAADPMLGADSAMGSWMGRLGDILISENLADRVIFVPVSVSNSIVEKWASGSLKYHVNVAMRRCASLGWDVSAVLWQLGETDGIIGTSQLSYSSDLSSLIQRTQDDGFAAPWLLAKSTTVSGVPSAAIRSAIDGLIDGTRIFDGPDIDTIPVSKRHSDGTHLVASGAAAAAALWKSAIVSAGVSPSA